MGQKIFFLDIMNRKEFLLDKTSFFLSRNHSFLFKIFRKSVFALFFEKKKTYKMPICLQKPSCRQQNPLLAGGNNRKSLLPTNSSRPLFNQIAIFSGKLTEHFNCKCFLLYTCELLEISPSGKDISLSIMTSRILASVHEQEPVKTDQEEL